MLIGKNSAESLKAEVVDALEGVLKPALAQPKFANRGLSVLRTTGIQL